MSNKFSISQRLKSFGYAFSGLVTLVTDQHNARIHLVATVFVILLGFYVELTRVEWLILLLIIAVVWLGEALNSAVEYLADATVPEQHPLIKKAKDVAAAGVLIAAFAALFVGLLIFLPYLS
jgi:diacylglycerol kinase